MTNDGVRKEIAEIVKSVSKIEVDVNEIIDDTCFLEDLSFDSLTFVVMIIEIEAKFDIELDNEVLLFDNSNTYGQLCSFVSDALDKTK